LVWGLADFTYSACLISIIPTVDGKKFSDAVHDCLKQQTEIEFGVSTTQTNAIIVRVLDNKAEQLFHCLKTITLFLEKQLTHV
jgi:urease accessory protein UreH